MSSPRPPRRLSVQSWLGARIPTSLLSTILTAARCLFRICPSLWARAAVVFNSAFTTVPSSRLGRSAQCCCSNHPPGLMLCSSSASAPSSLSFCLGLLPLPLGTPFVVAGAVISPWCGETTSQYPWRRRWRGSPEDTTRTNEGSIRLNDHLCINAALTALGQRHVKLGNHFII